MTVGEQTGGHRAHKGRGRYGDPHGRRGWRIGRAWWRDSDTTSRRWNEAARAPTGQPRRGWDTGTPVSRQLVNPLCLERRARYGHRGSFAPQGRSVPVPSHPVM